MTKSKTLLGEYYTPTEIADLLAWHPKTIHRHLVPISEWERGSGQVPYRLLGDRKMVPRWWIESVLHDARNPPPEPSER